VANCVFKRPGCHALLSTLTGSGVHLLVVFQFVLLYSNLAALNP
jgi:hypothetical protein